MSKAPVSIKKPHIKIALTNRWAEIDCDPEDQEKLKKHFRYQRPNYDRTDAYISGAWDGYTNLLKRGRVPAGLWLDRIQRVSKAFDVEILDTRIAPEFLPSEGESREYQGEAVEKMIAASGTGCLILSATGTGKTRIAGSYFRRLKGTGVFIVDELALLEQTRRELKEVIQETIGIVGKSEFKPGRISVATVQTLDRHKQDLKFRKWFKTIDVVIIDELHVMLNKRSADVVNKIRPKAVFGLTATLELDKEHVRMEAVAMTGPPLFEYSIKEGVSEGYLSKSVICCVKFYDPLKGVSPAYRSSEKIGGQVQKIMIQGGSSRAEYRYHIVCNHYRNDCIQKLIEAGLALKLRIIVIVEQKLHLKFLSKRLENYRHEALSGSIKPKERLAALEKMDHGELDLILASKIFAKGVNVRSVNLIIDATGLPSRNNAIQRHGRGTRTAESKQGLIHLDIADYNNKFAGAAVVRRKALQAIGSPVITKTWENNPKAILKNCLQTLALGDGGGEGKEVVKSAFSLGNHEASATV